VAKDRRKAGIKKRGNVHINVILRAVHVTSVAMEKH
jgi:hypothetical protein